jgi:hypothetical protein
MTNEVDLTGLNKEQLHLGLADMVLSLIRSHRIAILVGRPDGVITFINPIIMQEISPEVLAAALLESWSEEDVGQFMEHVYG